MLSSVATQLGEYPATLVRVGAQAVHLLVPAKMPENLLAEGFSQDLLNPEYGIYVQVLIENALYGLMLLTLGCVAFGYREIRLK